MTTKLTDTMYAMFQKLSPLRMFPRGTAADPLAKQITRRWNEIAPWVLIEARRAIDPSSAFYEYRMKHEDYLRRLLIAGLPMRTIAANELDSPLSPPAYFDELFRHALERRSSRMGRIKGTGKKYANRHKEMTK